MNKYKNKQFKAFHLWSVFLIYLRGDVMKIADLLSKEEKSKLINVKSPKRKRKKKPPSNPQSVKTNEKLSRRDIEELMGINRATYTRVNGAVRRK
jgi:hypothetical protein